MILFFLIYRIHLRVTWLCVVLKFIFAIDLQCNFFYYSH